MEAQQSAFEVYQKLNKRKRTAIAANDVAPKKQNNNLPVKQLKKASKSVAVVPKPAKTKAKNAQEAKSGKILTNQKKYPISGSSDEEEIPMLIPISDTVGPKKSINSKDKKIQVVTKKSVISSNGKSSKNPTGKSETLQKSYKKPELLDHGDSSFQSGQPRIGHI